MDFQTRWRQTDLCCWPDQNHVMTDVTHARSMGEEETEHPVAVKARVWSDLDADEN